MLDGIALRRLLQPEQHVPSIDQQQQTTAQKAKAPILYDSDNRSLPNGRVLQHGQASLMLQIQQQ